MLPYTHSASDFNCTIPTHRKIPVSASPVGNIYNPVPVVAVGCLTVVVTIKTLKNNWQIASINWASLFNPPKREIVESLPILS